MSYLILIQQHGEGNFIISIFHLRKLRQGKLNWLILDPGLSLVINL